MIHPDRQSKNERHRPPKLAWVASGVGLVLALGAIGLMLYEQIRGGSAPPAIIVQAERIVPTGSGYTVEFLARNIGHETAAQVRIEGALKHGGAIQEIGTALIDYVPEQSERRGGLFFTHDPRQAELELRATGYSEP